MARLSKHHPHEVKSKAPKPEILCSGYLCPKAPDCQRFHAMRKFHSMMQSGRKWPMNVVFQSSTINPSGNCVNFVAVSPPTYPSYRKRKQDGPHG